MDIIIKSFNRPYYLDRCLLSILKMVKGTYNVIVLDDGTPQIYLDKLKQKYPQVSFMLSEQANQKRKAIEENNTNGTPIDGFQIPTKLWKDAVSKANKYVLVTEDDVWFTKEIDINDIVQDMENYKIPLVKLGWLGIKTNEKDCNHHYLTKNLIDVTPKNLFTANKKLMDWLMFNKFKFFSILYKFGIVDNFTRDKYWNINSILMGLYNKEYWLAIWADADGKVDEKQQLRNAAAWYHKNRNSVFTKTNDEVMKTTFKSSATGSYHQYGNHFDVNRMNFILNEAWLKGEFDSLENYPNDFSDEYFKKFLVKANHPDSQYDEWFLWAQQFKSQYRNQGAEVQ